MSTAILALKVFISIAFFALAWLFGGAMREGAYQKATAWATFMVAVAAFMVAL